MTYECGLRLTCWQGNRLPQYSSNLHRVVWWRIAKTIWNVAQKFCELYCGSPLPRQQVRLSSTVPWVLENIGLRLVASSPGSYLAFHTSNKASNQTLSGDNRTLSGDNKTLSGDNQTLSGDNRTLSGDNKTLSGDNRTLSGDNRTLSGDNRTLSGDNLTLSGDNRTLSGDNRTLSGNNRTLNGDNRTQLVRMAWKWGYKVVM